MFTFLYLQLHKEFLQSFRQMVPCTCNGSQDISLHRHHHEKYLGETSRRSATTEAKSSVVSRWSPQASPNHKASGPAICCRIGCKPWIKALDIPPKLLLTLLWYFNLELLCISFTVSKVAWPEVTRFGDNRCAINMIPESLFYEWLGKYVCCASTCHSLSSPCFINCLVTW